MSVPRTFDEYRKFCLTTGGYVACLGNQQQPRETNMFASQNKFAKKPKKVNTGPIAKPSLPTIRKSYAGATIKPISNWRVGKYKSDGSKFLWRDFTITQPGYKPSRLRVYADHEGWHTTALALASNSPE